MTLNQTINLINVSKDHLNSFKNHEGENEEKTIPDNIKSTIKIF